jgi:hypothetical protein
MHALGRTLQVLGWLWFLAGIVGPIFDFERFNFFPGLVLIFIARVIRAQRRRTEQAEPETQGSQRETPPPERVLNTERRQPSAPSPSPRPTVDDTDEHTTQPEPMSKSSEERDDLLERIVAAGREGADEVETPDDPGPQPAPGSRAPISSEQMIARAHRRWDSKRR